MDYLKYRGCHVSVISRFVPELPPSPFISDKDLDQQKYEDLLSQLGAIEAKEKSAKERSRSKRAAGNTKLKALVMRNQNQNFSYNNFGLGEELGTTETYDQAEKVQRLRSEVEAKNRLEAEKLLDEQDPDTLLERCKNNKLLSPEYSIFDDGDENEWYGKKRSDNVVFAQDHLRTWEITNAGKGPLSPSQNTQNYN